MGKPCRYCKSPSKLRPCWWYLDHPEDAGGGDPPCMLYTEQAEHRGHSDLLGFVPCIGVMLLVLIFLMHALPL